jgi:hypothetical protein
MNKNIGPSDEQKISATSREQLRIFNADSGTKYFIARKQRNSGYANAPQCDIIHTLPILLWCLLVQPKILVAGFSLRMLFRCLIIPYAICGK